MEYFVIANDGSKFGPATLEMLNKWAAEGRVLADSVIERASDGVRGPASLLPGLALPQTPAAPPDPGVPPPSAPPSGTPSTAGTPGNVQFREPEFQRPQQPMTPPAYGDPHPPAASPYMGYPRQQSYSYDVLPPELSGKFNWGAFLMTWIWGLNHKAYLTLIALGLWIVSIAYNVASNPRLFQAGQDRVYSSMSPVRWIFDIVGLGLAIWFGIKGYEWAWQSGRFRTPEECRKCQAIWGWWGLGLFLLCCVCIGGVVFMAVAATASVAGGSSRPF